MAAEPDDPEVESDQEGESKLDRAPAPPPSALPAPQASAAVPAPSPAPVPAQATAPAPAPAPVSPQEPPPAAAPNPEAVKSFAAAGYGAPSAGYTPPPPAAAPVPQAEPAPAPQAPDDRRAAARKDLEDRTVADWKAANPFKTSFDAAPRPTDQAYAQAERESDIDAQRQERQQLNDQQRTAEIARRQANSDQEAQYRGSGQQFFKDELGNLRPILESGTNRPLFHKTGWQGATDPQTGQPMWGMRDQYGQRQYRQPPIVANPDLSDDNAHFKMPDRTTVDSGRKLEDFAQSSDFNVKKQALAQITKRNAARHRQALVPMEELAKQTNQEFTQAQIQRDNYVSQVANLDAMADAEPDPAKKDAYASQKAQIIQAHDALDAQLKPGGAMFLKNDTAQKELRLAKARQIYQAYTDQNNEIEARVRAQGGKPENDPTWQTNQHAIQQWQALIGPKEQESQNRLAAAASTSQPLAAPGTPPGAQPAPAGGEPNSFQGAEPFNLLQNGVKSVGAVSVQELAKRYGDGRGKPAPLSLVQIQQRSDDLKATIDESGNNIDPKLAAGMKEEKDYLDNLYKQRYAQLNPGDRVAVDRMLNLRDTSALGAAGRAAGVNVGPAIGAAVGGSLGGKAGMQLPGELKVPGAIAMSGIGALAGGILVDKAQREALKKASPESLDALEQMQKIDEQKHPFATAAGQLLGNLAVFKANPRMAAVGLAGLWKIATGKGASKVEQLAAQHLAVQAGLGTAAGVASPLLAGQKPTLKGVTQAAAQTLIFGETHFGGHAAPAGPEAPAAETGTGKPATPPEPAAPTDKGAAAPLPTELTPKERAVAGTKVGTPEEQAAAAKEFEAAQKAPAAPKQVPEAPQAAARTLPEGTKVEYLGKQHQVMQGVGEPVDHWQVKIPGDERGRTLTRDQLEKDGFDTSKLPTEAPAQPKPEGEQKDAIPKQVTGPEAVRNQPQSGEGVRVENPVDKGPPGAREGQGEAEAPRPVPAPEAGADDAGKPREAAGDAGDNGPGKVLKPEEVSKLGADDFRDYAKGFDKSGGYTTEAYRIGGEAKGNPESIAKLAAARDSAAQESKAALDKGNYDDALSLANKAQFFSEAHGRATNTGSAAEGPGGAGSAREGRAEPATPPEPSGRAATETAPANEGGQGPGAKNVGAAIRKGKRISVGLHPAGGQDILNRIEDEGGVQTKSGAGDKAGGEHDDLGSSFTGVARLLLRKKGTRPDQMAEMLHSEGLIPDGYVATMNDAVQRAVTARQQARKAMDAREYGDKFERSFLGNDHPKKWLRADKAISVDDLVTGDKFTVNGEKFEVKHVDENGNVTVKDGITKVIPPGTEVHPDKGKVTKAPQGDDPFGAAAEAKPAAPEGAPAAEPKAPVKRRSDRIIEALQAAKIGRPGMVRSSTGFDMAHDAALDLAILGIKAGRSVADVIKIAISRMKALYPEATPEHEARLESVIRLADQSAQETAETQKPGSDQRVTSIKNAVVDEERAARGLPPAMQAGRRAFGTAWDEAMRRIEVDPHASENLVKELNEKPRAIGDTEDAMLLHRQIDLQNQFDKTASELLKSTTEDGFGGGQRELSEKASSLSDQLLATYNAGKSAGTETGRGLNARKMMAKEDYSLGKMTTRLRAAKGGGKLSDAETSMINTLHDKIIETQKAFDDYKAKTEDRQATVEADRVIRRIVKDVAESSKKQAKPSSVSSFIADRAAEARARMRERAVGGRVNDVTSLAADLADRAIIGAEYLSKGITKFSDWSSEMLKEFGDTVKPQLQRIFSKAQSVHDEFATAAAAAGRDTPAERESTVEGMKAAMKDGKKVGDLGNYAQKLAEQFVREGVTDREKLIDAVHGEMKKADPGITRREAMDAISGYGKFKGLSQDDVKAQLRDLKGQMQQVGKLEDMQKGEAPAKTGIERRTPSDEERRLIQQVNEAKRRGGFDVTDPAKQLKSALEGIKTRMRNTIADLDFQIATGKKTVKTKTDVPLDAEATALQAKRDALRTQFDAIFKKPEMTDAQRLAIASKSADSQIAEIQRQLKDGDIFDKEGRPAVTSPALEAKRAQLEALRQEREYARQLLQPGDDPKSKADIALQAYKTRTTKRIADLEQRVANGDVERAPRGTVQKDPAAETLGAKAEEVKLKFDRMVRAHELATRSPWQKVGDQISKGAHFLALTGYHSLEKLGSYSGGKALELPLHESVATIYSKLPGFRELYKKADFEGPSSAKAVAKFYTGAATKGVKAMIQQLRTGTTEAKLLYGKKDVNPRSWSDFPGNVHAAEKAVLLTGTQEMLKEKTDMGAPDAEQRVNEYANRSILQEDNQAAQLVNQGLENMKKAQKSTGKVSGPKTIASEAISTLLTKGIVRMPLNYIMQSLEGTPVGGAIGLSKLAAAKWHGMDTLKPAEANGIARLITKGAGYGAGLFALGLADGWKDDPKERMFGGYYQPGDKRDPNDVPAGTIRIAGHVAPHLFTHLPTLEVVQMGNTLARTLKHVLGKDQKNADKNHISRTFWDKVEDGTAASFESSVATLMGLLGQSPVANTVFHASDLGDTSAGKKVLGNVAGGMVPGLSQNIASDTDKGVKRAPQGMVDSVKMGIPGLRQQVPLKRPKTKKLFDNMLINR